MARIRTVKPELFRHENLQDLEISNPDLRPITVFIALFGHCDKHGVFEWKPRQLQLDIIPFVWEATGKHLGSTLEALENIGMIQRYTDGVKTYGFIPTFEIHQRINGKEAQVPSSLPKISELTRVFAGEATEKQPRSNREATETTGREGKGREGELGREVKTLSDSAESNDMMFEKFWDAFAYKSGKAKALLAWKKLKPSQQLAEKIIAAAKIEAEVRPHRIANGQTPKMAEGWLSARRFEDECPVIVPLNHHQQQQVQKGMERQAIVQGGF